jgi:hypothetical protein
MGSIAMAPVPPKAHLGRAGLDPEGSRPRQRSPEGVHWAGPFRPKALGLRPNRTPLRRAASRPSSTPRRVGAGGSSSAHPPSAVTRIPEAGLLAADCAHPKVHSSARHPRPRPRGTLRRTSPRDPRRNRIEEASRLGTQGCTVPAARGSDPSSKLDGRSRARQFIFSIETARPIRGPVLSLTRRPASRRKRRGRGRRPRIPPGVGIRHRHRSAHAETDRGPSQALGVLANP